jgi:hypothetical protein
MSVDGKRHIFGPSLGSHSEVYSSTAVPRGSKNWVGVEWSDGWSAPKLQDNLSGIPDQTLISKVTAAFPTRKALTSWIANNKAAISKNWKPGTKACADWPRSSAPRVQIFASLFGNELINAGKSRKVSAADKVNALLKLASRRNRTARNTLSAAIASWNNIPSSTIRRCMDSVPAGALINFVKTVRSKLTTGDVIRAFNRLPDLRSQYTAMSTWSIPTSQVTLQARSASSAQTKKSRRSVTKTLSRNGVR